jgi:hypothetical protein
MAATKKQKGGTPHVTPTKVQLAEARRWADLLTAIVDRGGWPGLLVVFFGVVFVFFASPAQKQEFFAIYVLGHGIRAVYPIVVLSVLFVATVVAQFRIYGNQIAVLERELTRVADEKSKLQQELTATKLRSGKKLTTEDE